MTDEISRPRFLRLAEVELMTGLSRPTIYRLIKRHASEGGGFPAPVKVSRMSLWIEAEVLAWIEARAAERDAA